MRQQTLTSLFFVLSILTSTQASSEEPLQNLSTPQESVEVTVGRLKFVSTYPNEQLAHQITPLANGKVFVYGAFAINTDKLTAEAIEKARFDNAITGMDRDPRIWLPNLKAWVRVDAPPECTSNRSLYTATPLNDNEVLIAGGFCDYSQAINDRKPYAPYTKLSKLNTLTLKWSSAPALKVARIYHSTNALKDGSVLIVGGEHDPSEVTPNNRVMTSVEMLKQDKMTSAPDLLVARAKHSATLLDDGRLMVAGGKGHDNQPLSAVETYDPATQQWQLVAPLNIARFRHSATLLADGRVMIAGGKDSKGHTLNSVEIWSPATNSWQFGSPLVNIVEGHSAVRLNNGDVLLAGGVTENDIYNMVSENKQVMVWDSKSETWHEGGSLATPIFNKTSNAITLAPQANGSALLFAINEILQWQPNELAVAPPSNLPSWSYRPTLTALADGRLLAVSGQEANIWDPKTNQFDSAGMLTHIKTDSSRAILLPSNNVIHIDVPLTNAPLNCDIWIAALNLWEDCSDHELMGQIASKPGLGLMDDGRLALVTDFDLAFVFDESNRQWLKLKAQWFQEGLGYGAPITSNQPLLKAYDPTKGTWLNLSAAAGHFWQSISNAITTPDLLWSNKKQHWTYLFESGKMGKNPVTLPDGCVFTWSKFKLFNPKTGTIKQLMDPGIGIRSSHGDVAILADGTAVFVGVGNSTSNVGRGAHFYQRKLSCNGFETLSDSIEMPAIYKTLPPETQAPTVNNVARQPTSKSNTVWEQLLLFATQYKWNLLAVFGPVTLYFLVRKLSRSSATQRATNKNTTPIQTTKTNSNHRSSTISFSTVLRIIIYGLLAIYAWSSIKSYMHMRAMQANELCATNNAECIDKATGLLQSGVSDDHGQPIHSKLPCQYIGVWSSRPIDHGHNEMYRFTLKDDGTYTMMNPGASENAQPSYKGYWAIQDKNFVWRDNASITGEADINPIKTISSREFILTEMNGHHTRFELIEAIRSDKCAHE